MKIAYVANNLQTMNGADIVGADILLGLLAAGIPLTVISQDVIALPTTLEGRSLVSPRWVVPPPWIPFPRRITRNLPLTGARWIASKFALRRKRDLLQEITREIMVVNGFANGFVWNFLAPVRTRQSVLVVHDSPRRYTLLHQPPVEYALQEMEKYTHFIFPSCRVRDEWLSHASVAARQQRHIPYSCREDLIRQVMSQDRAAVRKRLGIPGDRFLAVCVASVQYRKGQDVLLDCFPAIRSAVPDIMLYLVGPTFGTWADSLAKRVQTGGFGDSVRIVGARADALEFLYGADVLLLPSRSEVQPVTILEAMVLHTPVIASDVDGIPELIQDGVSGFLFSLEEPEGLVERLEILRNDVEKRRLFAERASRRYWEYYSRKHMLSRMSEAVGTLARGEAWC